MTTNQDSDTASLVASLRKLAYYAHHDVSIAEEAADLIEALQTDAERWRNLCHLLEIAHHGGGVCAENFSLYTSVQSAFKSYRNMRLM